MTEILKAIADSMDARRRGYAEAHNESQDETQREVYSLMCDFLETLAGDFRAASEIAAEPLPPGTRFVSQVPPYVPVPPDGWSQCATCHKQWRTGQDGSHSCAEHLAASLRTARGKLRLIQQIQFEGMPEPWRTRVCDVLANGMDRGNPVDPGGVPG